MVELADMLIGVTREHSLVRYNSLARSGAHYIDAAASAVIVLQRLWSLIGGRCIYRSHVAVGVRPRPTRSRSSRPLSRAGSTRLPPFACANERPVGTPARGPSPCIPYSCPGGSPASLDVRWTARPLGTRGNRRGPLSGFRARFCGERI